MEGRKEGRKVKEGGRKCGEYKRGKTGGGNEGRVPGNTRLGVLIDENETKGGHPTLNCIK